MALSRKVRCCAQCAILVLFVCVAASVCFPLQRTSSGFATRPAWQAIYICLPGCFFFLSRRAACVWVLHGQYHGCLHTPLSSCSGHSWGLWSSPTCFLLVVPFRGLDPWLSLTGFRTKSGCTCMCIWPVIHPLQVRCTRYFCIWPLIQLHHAVHQHSAAGSHCFVG